MKVSLRLIDNFGDTRYTNERRTQGNRVKGAHPIVLILRSPRSGRLEGRGR